MAYNSAALNSYQKAQVYDEIDPKKLILMLYEGAIKRIKLSRKGLQENDPCMRGENLGKAIAIISELNASLDTSVKSEEIEFLSGLYNAMLIELPKVAVTKDVVILDRTEKYLTELKRIWETTVMKKKRTPRTAPTPPQPGYNRMNAPVPPAAPPRSHYPDTARTKTSFAV